MQQDDEDRRLGGAVVNALSDGAVLGCLQESRERAIAPDPKHSTADPLRPTAPLDPVPLAQRKADLLRELDGINATLGLPSHFGGNATVSSAQDQVDAAGMKTDPPEAVADALRGLRPWMQKYALALMEYGGIVALACRRCKVSQESVAKAQKAVPQFASACSCAAEHSANFTQVRAISKAVGGDSVAIQQGDIRGGSCPKESTKHGSRSRKLRELGLEVDESANEKSTAVDPVDRGAVLTIVAAVAARLFALNKGRLP